MSDAEEEAPAAAQPLLRVRSSHTGAEFEGQLLNRNRGAHRPMFKRLMAANGAAATQQLRACGESWLIRRTRRRYSSRAVTGRGSVKVFRGSSAVASAPSSRQTTMARSQDQRLHRQLFREVRRRPRPRCASCAPLEQVLYCTTEDAEHDSWLLLEKVSDGD